MKTITRKEWQRMQDYAKYRTPEEIAADQQHEYELSLHESGECWGDRRCYFCAEAEDLDGMVEHVNRELDKEEKK